jgi:hypothetical protein
MRKSSKVVSVVSGAVFAAGMFASAGSFAGRAVDEPGFGFASKVVPSGTVNVSAPVYSGRRIDNVAQIVNRGEAVEIAALESSARPRAERAAPFMGRPVDNIR